MHRKADKGIGFVDSNCRSIDGVADATLRSSVSTDDEDLDDIDDNPYPLPPVSNVLQPLFVSPLCVVQCFSRANWHLCVVLCKFFQVSSSSNQTDADADGDNYDTVIAHGEIWHFAQFSLCCVRLRLRFVEDVRSPGIADTCFFCASYFRQLGADQVVMVSAKHRKNSIDVDLSTAQSQIQSLSASKQQQQLSSTAARKNSIDIDTRPRGNSVTALVIFRLVLLMHLCET